MADDADIAAGYQEQLNSAGIEGRTKYEGVSSFWCEECDEIIPHGRREAVPGVKLCLQCTEDMEVRLKLLGVN